MVKTIFDALKYGTDVLKENNVESYLSDAKILLCHILNCDKNYLLVHKNDELILELFLKYKELIKKRADKMPVKYITGICEFYSLPFYVSPDVLIPRPDTEIIIDRAICEFKKDDKLKILDLCTGSGCIGISLATIFKNSNVTLVDISEKALAIADKNIKKHNLQAKINVIKKDILTDTIDEKYDLIVSNPPYISEKDFVNLEKDVKNYEPEIALVSHNDEYKFYKRIIDVYWNNLNENGIILLEMGYNQWEYLYNFAKQSDKFSKIEIEKDLSGINRVLILKK